ncbi:MAG TPA: translation elongation factor Ts, partial [Acidimicrobiales bacterium]|nr:translation elongation factor Ts [Acidimicrobiales bacterium]
DFDRSITWLREQGLASQAKRADREASEGAVAIGRTPTVASIVQLRSETDFVAKSDEFVRMVDELAQLVAEKDEAAVDELAGDVEQMATTLKENISIGRVERLEAADGEVLDTYLHQQDGRGKNGVAVILRGATQEKAHELAVHIAFGRPQYLRREDVPESEVTAERETVEAISRKEGKPEAALPKIVDGRMNGWFKERVLLEQPYVRDEKLTVAAWLGDAEVVRFAQVVVGA